MHLRHSSQPFVKNVDQLNQQKVIQNILQTTVPEKFTNRTYQHGSTTAPSSDTKRF